MLFALYADGIMEIIWFLDNFWVPLLVLPLITGFLRFRTNSRSFLICNIMGLIFTLIAAYIDGQFATPSMMVGIVGSALGLFGGHYVQKLMGDRRYTQAR